jgi:hypothetical protein
VTEAAAFGEDADPFLSLPASETSESVLAPAEGTAPHLLLSDEQCHKEAVLAAAIALEFIRLVAPTDPRTTARYAATTVDNSRLLAGGNSKLHLNLLRGQLRWLRGLKPGELG